MQMVNAAVSISKDFVTWQKGKRPRVTYIFFRNHEFEQELTSEGEALEDEK